MKAVFLDLDTIDRGDLDLSTLKAAVPEWSLRRNTAKQDLATVIRDVDIIVTNKVILDDRAFSAAAKTRLVCVAATGIDNVDLGAAGAHNVTVCNARGYATASVVEHVFAMALSLSRNLGRYQNSITNGAWQHSTEFCLLDYPIDELAGRTLGIIGYGELGRAVARLGKAFGMQVLVAERRGVRPRPGRIRFDDLLSGSDIISLHCPLTPDTRQLINAAELNHMRPDAILINAARGGIVDESALLDALQQGRIGGAAVDVLTREPPVGGNPLLEARLDNLIVTPHIAWASRASRQRLVSELTRNIQDFVAGRPRNVVS